MTQSLEQNLQQNWSEEERRRLDAATPPADGDIDHTNRDHEYAPAALGHDTCVLYHATGASLLGGQP
jgi:hypothetical protein